MIIEILDAQGGVITKVQTGEPDVEVATYGGDSWREWVEPAASILGRTRSAKQAAVYNHMLTLVGALVPALSSVSTLDLMVALLTSGMLNQPAPGSEMERAKDIYIYAQGRIAFGETATQAQLDAYDPATDVSWPT